jgi:hypothetical protein
MKMLRAMGENATIGQDLKADPSHKSITVRILGFFLNKNTMSKNQCNGLDPELSAVKIRLSVTEYVRIDCKRS